MGGAGEQFVLEGIPEFLQGLTQCRLGNRQALRRSGNVPLLKQDLQRDQEVEVGAYQFARNHPSLPVITYSYGYDPSKGNLEKHIYFLKKSN